jgi:uncharacterized protein YigE (DUF2233 family)
VKLSIKPFFRLLLFIFLAAISPEVLAETHWQPLSPGIDYTDIPNPHTPHLSYLHCFKINLQKNHLKLAFAQDDIFPAETVKWLAKRNRALIAVNGGFFTSNWRPIGLRIQHFKQRSRVQPTSWWPIFYIQNNVPYIIDEKKYQKNANISLAIQGGPRLLHDGKILSLKPGKAERTALGITQNYDVIIDATENWPLSTKNLARLFKENLNCVQAMNLDGGSSTQLYARIGDFKLDIGSLGLITDILYVSV